jgi:hypothetical protein
MRLGRLTLGTLGATAAFMMMSSTAFAHDCFNPQKDAHAPTAGVNYTIVGFDQNGPIFEQTGPGKGIGGFAALDPAVTGAPEVLYVHTMGHSRGTELAGGPGSQTAEHACDGKGIDYLEACFAQ